MAGRLGRQRRHLHDLDEVRPQLHLCTGHDTVTPQLPRFNATMAEFGQLKKSSLPWAGYLMVKLTRSTYQLVQLFGEI